MKRDSMDINEYKKTVLLLVIAWHKLERGSIKRFPPHEFKKSAFGLRVHVHLISVHMLWRPPNASRLTSNHENSPASILCTDDELSILRDRLADADNIATIAGGGYTQVPLVTPLPHCSDDLPILGGGLILGR